MADDAAANVCASGFSAQALAARAAALTAFASGKASAATCSALLATFSALFFAFDFNLVAKDTAVNEASEPGELLNVLSRDPRRAESRLMVSTLSRAVVAALSPARDAASTSSQDSSGRRSMLDQ